MRYVVLVIVLLISVIGTVGALDSIELLPASPSGTLETIEASAEGRIVEVGTAEASLVATPSAMPTQALTITPLPTVAVLTNPFAKLWDSITGGNGEDPIPDDPAGTETIFWRGHSEAYHVVFGQDQSGEKMIWIRSTNPGDVWQKIAAEGSDLPGADTQPALYENSLVWLNAKKTALYRYEILLQSFQSQSYRKPEETSITFTDAIGQPITATYDEMDNRITFTAPLEQ